MKKMQKQESREEKSRTLASSCVVVNHEACLVSRKVTRVIRQLEGASRVIKRHSFGSGDYSLSLTWLS